MSFRDFRFYPALLLSILFFPSPGFSYDNVQADRTIPLIEKKLTPTVLRIDKDGNFWVLNSKAKLIQQISNEGLCTVTIKEELKNPNDFAFLSDGSMIISDPGLKQVFTLKPSTVAIQTADQETSKVWLDWNKRQVVTRIPVTNPTAVAASHDDFIAVSDKANNSVHLYTVEGLLIHDFYPPLKEVFENITALAFSNDGTLFVLDNGKGKLHRYSPDRKWLGSVDGLDTPNSIVVDPFGFAYLTINKGKWIEVGPDGIKTGQFGAKGKKLGQLSLPYGIAVDKGKKLWVSETGNKRLQSFIVTNNKKTKKLLTEPVCRMQIRLINKWPLQVDKISLTPQDKLLSVNNKKIQFTWMDLQGKEISSFELKAKKGKGIKQIGDIALDSADHIWVTDPGDESIKQISPAGEILKTMGTKGREEGSIVNPSFIRLREDMSMVVVDKNNSRIQVISPDNLFLFGVGEGGEAPGQFETVSGVAVNSDRISVIDNKRKALIFYDSNGKFISEIANKKGESIIWADLCGLETNETGRFFVLDKGTKRVRVFEPNGTFLADFSFEGKNASFGRKGRFLIHSEREVSTYAIDFVPLGLEELQAADDHGVVKISWKPCQSCVSYHIYKATPTSDFGLVASTPTTIHFDENVTPGVEYTYGVRGVSALGYEGNWTETKPVVPSKRKDISLISLLDINFNPIFTAAFKYYVNHPIGTVAIQNNSDKIVRNTKLSLSLKKYTDFATEKIIAKLNPGEKQIIPVTMTLNDSVLELTENTPVQVDIKLNYYEENEEKNVSKNAPVTLYSRNATVWTDKARINSFITPRDMPVMEFSRAGIRAFLPELKGSTVGKPLAKAALFYESMNALKISYVPDPTTPFSQVSGIAEAIDFVQFPRETLRRKTGDCDDTTALLSSLLESIGVETALVDTPGHIFLMANLEESDPQVIGLPAERFVEFQGTFWVPIETTQLGKNFIDAWQTALNEVRMAEGSAQVEFIRVSKANENYPPVTLIEQEKELVPFPAENARKGFMEVLTKLQTEKYENLLAMINEEIKKDPSNKLLQIRLGTVHVEGGNPTEGKKIFESFLEDPDIEVKAAANNNMGNLAYLNGDYQSALKYYNQAAAGSPKDGGIIINQARASLKLGDKATAKKQLMEAKNVLPDWKEFATDFPADVLP